MVANALLLTLAILLAYVVWLIGELKFLVPYRNFIFHTYGTIILAWFGTLFVNLFALVYLIARKFFLKDTGRKLVNIRRGWLRLRNPMIGYSRTLKQENRIGRAAFRRTG
jgi:hypothetical protein